MIPSNGRRPPPKKTCMISTCSLDIYWCSMVWSAGWIEHPVFRRGGAIEPVEGRSLEVPRLYYAYSMFSRIRKSPVINDESSIEVNACQFFSNCRHIHSLALPDGNARIKNDDADLRSYGYVARMPRLGRGNPVKLVILRACKINR